MRDFVDENRLPMITLSLAIVAIIEGVVLIVLPQITPHTIWVHPSPPHIKTVCTLPTLEKRVFRSDFAVTNVSENHLSVLALVDPKHPYTIDKQSLPINSVCLSEIEQ